MFRGVALIEVGPSVRKVQTGLCESIREVVKEIAMYSRDGRIASCDIWMRVNKRWCPVKSMTLA